MPKSDEPIVEGGEDGTIVRSGTDPINTHAILGGFKARPRNDWTLYFDEEYGEPDNVFARNGNYDYTNFRLRSRYSSICGTRLVLIKAIRSTRVR